MTKTKAEPTSINEFILQIIKEKKPEDIKQLTKIIEKQFSLSEQEIVEYLLRLQSEGKITLKKTTPLQIPKKLPHFLRTGQAYWYWTTILLTVTTTIVVFTVPEDAYPIVYARHILGSIFVIWMPGYTFIKALFPKKLPIQTSSSELDNVERIALSIGMSLALVPLVGLLLNYTPWGIRLTPITLSLLVLTLTFATAALLREHQIGTKINKPES